MVELMNAAYNQRVLGVTTAGNDNVSYTDRTPGETPNTCTVAASDKVDNCAFYSNWGLVSMPLLPGPISTRRGWEATRQPTS